MIPVYITDIIGEVVAAAKTAKYNGTNVTLLQTIRTNETAAIESTLISTINFQYGHKKELIETLIQMDQNPDNQANKYPLVYLVQDFSEERGKAVGQYAEVSLNVIIAHSTRNDHKITDRMTKVFKPVLYPIYYQFMKFLAAHPMVNVINSDMIPHKKTDRSYWGRNAVGGTDALKLNDYVDAIEIENLQLKINYKSGCP